MGISIIAAFDLARNIGFEGDMPWGKDMKGDLKRFKELTTGHPVIMGTKTLMSLPGTLGKREYHILTRQKQYGSNKAPWRNPDWYTHNSIESVLEAVKDKEAFVIGGAEVYAQMIPHADKIYITKIHELFEGDTKFPSIYGAWKIEYSDKQIVEGDKYPSEYITYTRRS